MSAEPKHVYLMQIMVEDDINGQVDLAERWLTL